MKISAKGRYALRLMVDLAQHENGEWIALKDISQRQGISVKYLEQIVSGLSRAGLLRSSRGAAGGYQLTRPAAQYTAGEIIRALEGSLAPVACLEQDPNRCPRRGVCPTIRLWEGLYDVVNQYLDSYTLADIAQAEIPGYDFSI
jgi:Rrf2 family protein